MGEARSVYLLSRVFSRQSGKQNFDPHLQKSTLGCPNMLWFWDLVMMLAHTPLIVSSQSSRSVTSTIKWESTQGYPELESKASLTKWQQV